MVLASRPWSSDGLCFEYYPGKLSTTIMRSPMFPNRLAGIMPIQVLAKSLTIFELLKECPDEHIGEHGCSKCHQS